MTEDRFWRITTRSLTYLTSVIMWTDFYVVIRGVNLWYLDRSPFQMWLFLGFTGSPAFSSCSTSRSTRTESSNSEEEADDERDDDDDDFLGSASDIWSRVNSVRSERDATFYNDPKAFYKFICEEDSSKTDVKITLGITARLNLPDKLKHILCVLYTRRHSDKAARSFLRRLPRGLLDDAVDRGGGGRDVKCYPLDRICQTLWKVYQWHDVAGTLSAFFKICFSFVLLYNESLNDCSLGERWILFPSNLNVFLNFISGTLRFSGNRIHCSPRDQWRRPLKETTQGEPIRFATDFPQLNAVTVYQYGFSCLLLTVVIRPLSSLSKWRPKSLDFSFFCFVRKLLTPPP